MNGHTPGGDQPPVTTGARDQGDALLTAQRRLAIAAQVRQYGAVSKDALARQFGVTTMTVYRDLKVLEAQGKVQMVRGGALLPTPEVPYSPHKRLRSAKNKADIARLAAELFVRPDEVIAMEAGTTVMALVPHIAQRGNTVITNGLETIRELAGHHPGGHYLSCGGVLRAASQTFVGPQALAFFGQMHSGTLFLGASGYILADGFTDANPLEIQVKRAMMAHCGRAVMLIDSSKFNQRSLMTLARPAELFAVVTDHLADEKVLSELREQGLQVFVAVADAPPTRAL